MSLWKDVRMKYQIFNSEKLIYKTNILVFALLYSILIKRSKQLFASIFFSDVRASELLFYIYNNGIEHYKKLTQKG